MEIVIKKELDSKYEILRLMSDFERGIEFTEDSVRSTYKQKFDDVWAYFKKAVSFTQEVKEKVVMDDSTFTLLFHPLTNQLGEVEFSLALLLLKYEKSNLSPFEVLLEFMNEDKPDQNVFDWIVALDVKDELRYRLLMFVTQTERLLEVYHNWLDAHQWCIDLYESRFHKDFAVFVETFNFEEAKEHLMGKVLKADFFNTVERINVTMLGLRLNQIEIMMDEKNVVDLKVGQHSLDLFRKVNEGNVEIDRFQRALKFLSDSTKLEILRLCNREPHYGAQLAKKLKLTGATISHHMNDLMTAGFVQVHIDKNKGYYRTQIGPILEALGYAKDILESGVNLKELLDES